MTVRLVRADDRLPQLRPVGANREFRAAAGRFATGVTVLTALRGDAGRGMTANSFASVSLDPPLVLVCLRTDSEMCQLIPDLGAFAVSVLAEDQRRTAAYFADPTRPSGPAQFDAVDWTPAPHSGAPLLIGALAWFDCEVQELVAAGDHLVLLGRVLALDEEPGRPLVFFSGAYSSLRAAFAPPNCVSARALDRSSW